MSDTSATRTRILDAAERLFARSGYDGVSVREIMREADSQLGLMSYYFTSKEALLEAVVGRRSGVINDRRHARLATIAGTDDSSIEKVVDVLLAPYFELMGEEGEAWTSYAKLNAQLAQSPRWSRLIKQNFDEVVSLLIDELERIVPDVARAEIIRAFVFAIGTMLAVLATSGRMRSLSDGYVLDDDFDAIRPQLSRFMSGGLRHALGVSD
ncbi:MAG TPA: TetR family transcriptional regulator [Pseudonocardia sp.]